MQYHEKRTALPPHHLDSKTNLYVKKYSPTTAQEYADQQVNFKGIPIKLGKWYDYATEQIKAGDSPDVIVNTLKRADKWTVSTTTLYRYIEQSYISGITSKDLV